MSVSKPVSFGTLSTVHDVDKRSTRYQDRSQLSTSYAIIYNQHYENLPKKRK